MCFFFVVRTQAMITAAKMTRCTHCTFPQLRYLQVRRGMFGL